MSCSFQGGPAKVSCSSLCLIFKDLKRPDDPECEHRGETAPKELSDLVLEDIRVTAEAVQDQEIGGHQSESTDVQHSKACVAVSYLPGLSCLPFDFCIFKGTLNDGSRGG